MKYLKLILVGICCVYGAQVTASGEGLPHDMNPDRVAFVQECKAKLAQARTIAEEVVAKEQLGYTGSDILAEFIVEGGDKSVRGCNFCVGKYGAGIVTAVDSTSGLPMITLARSENNYPAAGVLQAHLVGGSAHSTRSGK